MVLKNEKGFLLISIIFMMLLLAVTIFSINYYSSTQMRMAKNHENALKTDFELRGIVEASVWELTKDIFLRPSEEIYPFNGIDYKWSVKNSEIQGYTDAVTIEVSPADLPNSVPVEKSFRYFALDALAGFDDVNPADDGNMFKNPGKIFMDSSGENILIADTENHRIRKIQLSSSSVITIAGIAGEDGDCYNEEDCRDNWPATEAYLDSPEGVCKDSVGNVYIADTGHHVIRKVDVDSKIITTFAGIMGSSGYSDEIVPADSAELNSPKDVAWHSGKLYIADTENHCIRRVDTLNGNEISTVAGNGDLESPEGICLDTLGNYLYIADTENHVIRKMNTENPGVTTKVAGTENSQGFSGDYGDAKSAQLDSPEDIFVDNNNHIFIADRNNKRIRVINAHNGNIYTFAGNGSSGDTVDLPAVEAGLKDPSSITMSLSNGGKRIYISAGGNNRLRVLVLKVASEL